MDAAELNQRFAIPGVLDFERSASGLVLARITSPAAAATVYLQGAHLTHWQPTGHAPVLFLSARSQLAPGKAIRGGVPVIFPWFGERHGGRPGERRDGRPGPQHGFARTAEWELAFAAMAGDELHLTFTLAPGDASRELGFDHFRVAYTMTIGRALTLQLTIANDPDAGAPLIFEEALHTYFAVTGAQRVSIDGLGGTAYLDKVDGFQLKLQAEGPLQLAGRTDRVYMDTIATCILHDQAAARRLVVEKSGSHSTVVWNPWSELCATMADMEPDGWLRMTCVETANVGDSAVTLQPGETHTMQATISVEASA